MPDDELTWDRLVDRAILILAVKGDEGTNLWRLYQTYENYYDLLVVIAMPWIVQH